MKPPRCLALALWLISSAAHADYVPGTETAPEPLRQFRGAWIASVHHLNWPSKGGLSASAQQAQLLALLDQAVSLRLNAIIFQVRPACDALYASKLEPWSQWLTGRMGGSPGYDPLEFAIREAHRRGLELHAWINPFRAIASNDTSPAANHVARTHPDWLRRYGSQQWMDPGEPQARAHTLAVCADLVRRYDLDGLHLDDYFYPYPIKRSDGTKIPFPDDSTYAAYGKGTDRPSWRRANIDAFVQALYAQVKAAKPAVKLGISPFGIWRPNVPSGIVARLDAYEELAGDSRKWLAQGWCDYFSPQLYWRIDPPDQSFSALFQWWTSQNSRQRHLWPGIATDRIESSDDPGRPAGEMVRQVMLTPQGQIHWNLGALKQNRGGLNPLLTKGPYAQSALVPASPWLGNALPARPQASLTESKLTCPAQSNTRWFLLQTKDVTGWKSTLLPSTIGTYQIPGTPQALSLRASSPTGLLGPAILWKR